MSAGASSQAASNDPVRIDANHYSAEYEDDRVRIVRVRYAPGEKSVMHAHPALIIIALTEGTIRMTYPDGRAEDITMTAGQAAAMPAVEHLPQNIGGRPFEGILVELKG